MLPSSATKVTEERGVESVDIVEKSTTAKFDEPVCASRAAYASLIGVDERHVATELPRVRLEEAAGDFDVVAASLVQSAGGAVLDVERLRHHIRTRWPAP